MNNPAETVVNHRQWEDDFDNALEQTFSAPQDALQDVIEVVFQIGILDRLSPENEQIKQIRLERGNLTWPGTRNDAELYYRIIYSAQACIHAIEHNWSLSFGGYVISAGNAFIRLCSYHRQKYLAELKDQKNEPIFFLRKLQHRCVAELISRNLPVPKGIMAVGKAGQYYGIPVIISGYSDHEGMIVLETTDPEKGLEHYMEICRANHGCWASPWEMHRGAFEPSP